MEASYDRAEFKRSFDRAERGLLYVSVIYKDRWCGSFAIHHTCAKYDGPFKKCSLNLKKSSWNFKKVHQNLKKFIEFGKQFTKPTH